MSGFLCSMVGATFTVAAAAEVLRSKKGITAVGNAQVDTAQSKFGGASALFDGTGDYLSVAHHSSLSLADYSNWTIECWVRLTDGTSRTILNKDGVAGSLYPGYTFYTNGSKQVNFGVGGSAGNWVTVTRSTALADNTWYHLAGVKNGSTITFYVDGVSAGTTTFVGYTDQSRALLIGWEQDGVYMYGHIDEVRVSNTARYTANFTPSTTPFVNDANTLLLIHANGTDASTFFEDDNGVRASVAVSAGGNAQISTAQSKFGGSSIVFDGNNDYVYLPSGQPSVASSNYTFECWARFDILPHNQTLDGGAYIMLNSADGNNYVLINRTGAGSQVSIQIAHAGGYGSFTKSGVNYAINTWYHIAVVRNSGVFKCFFNGTELTTFTNDSGFTNSGRTQDIYIGAIGKFVDSRGSMDGYMDEIRISNSARYTADFTPSTTPFVNDSNTLLLIHGDGTNASTVVRDDNGALANRQPKYITAVGNAQVDTAQSKFGGASAQFDGTGDHLLIPGSSDWRWNTTNYTIEFWTRVNTHVNTGSNNLPAQIGSMNPNSGTAFWNFGTDDVGKITFHYYNGAVTKVAGSTNLSTGVQYHLAMVYTSSDNTIKLYVDGTQAASAVVSGTPQFSDSLALCLGQYNSVGYNGHIDEFRISNSARYTTTFTPSTTAFVNDSNTLLLIHADGADATTAFFDDTGSRTQQSIQVNGNAQTDTAISKFGGSSLLLDGTGDAIQCSDDAMRFNASANRTIEFWIYSDRNNAIETLIFQGVNTGGTMDYWQWFFNSANLVLNIPGSSPVDVTITRSTGTWYHFAWVKQGNSNAVYWNGTSVATFTKTDSDWGLTDNNTLFIGYQQGGTTAFDGNIDEFRISSSARYTANFTPSTTPFQSDANTVLLLHMDGTDGSTVFFDDNGIAPYTP